MKPKHLKARINQCLAIAECSPCPRRKFGALLVDPKRNVVLMDGYNGGPRGGGSLCGGVFCLRDGAPTDREVYDVSARRAGPADEGFTHDLVLKTEAGSQSLGTIPRDKTSGEAIDEFIEAHPPIKSGTRYELGCHHAEMNVITNAAAQGVACDGAWLIVTGEPCVLCAKLIHHAGIAKVICVDGGFIGGTAGPEYLKKHGVAVEAVDGPKDPRGSES